MKKSKIYTLKNGLKLVFYQDTSKHCTIANLFVKFGGINKKVFFNDKEFNIIDGTAHFLEHLLIEHSPYGNALIEFEKNKARFNGFTNKDVTEFYIDSVYNFEEDLVKLINIVNKPSFNSKDIEETKPAIIKEIMMKKDNKYADLAKLDYECLFRNIKPANTLGEVIDIENMNYEYIKTCYDIFYNIKNQILFISGNFDMKKIKELVEKTYEEINKEEINYKVVNIDEPKEIVKKEGTIKKDVHTDFVRLTYKVDTSHLSNKEQVKLSFYLDYFLSYLFDSSSKIYSNLVKDKICDYSILYNYELVDKYTLVTIGTTTNNHDRFISEIEKAIISKELNKENFELKKKKTIIDIILREDSLSSTIGPFIDNIISYNYFNTDTIEDIEGQNFNDYQNIINSLDFSNYCITKMIREKE